MHLHGDRCNRACLMEGVSIVSRRANYGGELCPMATSNISPDAENEYDNQYEEEICTPITTALFKRKSRNEINTNLSAIIWIGVSEIALDSCCLSEPHYILRPQTNRRVIVVERRSQSPWMVIIDTINEAHCVCGDPVTANLRRF